MKLSMVVAMNRDGLIGSGGKLPWKLPRDMKNFRDLTWGKTVIMGRRTAESIGRPLRCRTNIVLSRKENHNARFVLLARNTHQAIRIAEAIGINEAFVIGGAEVYLSFLPLVDAIHVTVVEGQFSGDVYFPAPILDSPDWRVTHEESWPADEKNPHSAKYMVMVPNR